jgi:lipoprotein-anchoring transpeptidase ErfK/SrfK
MDSETLHTPIPNNGPGGYYLKNVLWTQYYKWTGQTIHYNYWSTNWGYAGSHGCLGLGYHEAKSAWDFADIGTSLRIWG